MLLHENNKNNNNNDNNKNDNNAHFLRSVGCLAIELVSGDPPYCKLNDIECLFKMSEAVMPPLPTNISAKCKDFLMKCLAPRWMEVAFLLLIFSLSFFFPNAPLPVLFLLLLPANVI